MRSGASVSQLLAERRVPVGALTEAVSVGVWTDFMTIFLAATGNPLAEALQSLANSEARHHGGELPRRFGSIHMLAACHPPLTVNHHSLDR